MMLLYSPKHSVRELSAFGRFLTVVTTVYAGQVECKRLVSTDAIDWAVVMQMGGQVHAITHPTHGRVLGSYTPSGTKP